MAGLFGNLFGSDRRQVRSRATHFVNAWIGGNTSAKDDLARMLRHAASRTLIEIDYIGRMDFFISEMPIEFIRRAHDFAASTSDNLSSELDPIMAVAAGSYACTAVLFYGRLGYARPTIEGDDLLFSVAHLYAASVIKFEQD